jgi:hypothetical protein
MSYFADHVIATQSGFEELAYRKREILDYGK